MNRLIKPIRLSQHARERLADRGVTEGEIIETIRTATWSPAEGTRWECRKEFLRQAMWHGHSYRIKLVRPIFVEEATELVVVTVYSYFS